MTSFLSTILDCLFGLFSAGSVKDLSEFDESVALLVARRTNNREVVGSGPTKVTCITGLTGNRRRLG